jgi:hypothetical protein
VITRGLRVLASSVYGCLLFVVAGPAAAFTLAFSSDDFSVTPTFSNVRTFSFSIEIAEPLAPGSYVDPALDGVQYSVRGMLAEGTPSGFSAFALDRTITARDFYAQGSSLRFEISASADLADGLQVAELVGPDPVFVFDGREVGTGRYHPAIVRLNADGTGSIRNSNNMGGTNPATGMIVDVAQGEEYISDLSFDPNQLTLVVPEPATALLVALGVIGLAVRQRSRIRPR